MSSGPRRWSGPATSPHPGLTENIELNIQIQSAREVAQLQEWFEKHWNDASEVTDAVIETIERHTRLYTSVRCLREGPPGVLPRPRAHRDRVGRDAVEDVPAARSLPEGGLLGADEDRRQHGGAFLCDGVGLGKTFVGLMLIERLVLHEGKRVVLFAPKATKEGVWEPHLREWLPHIGGVGGSADFSNLAVFSHTDLGRKGEFPERFQRIAELADVVIIDEAHHFRNPGSQGDPEEEQSSPRATTSSTTCSTRRSGPKTLFMLTATPINNRLSDFRHMAELFTRRDETYFARTLGVNNLTRALQQHGEGAPQLGRARRASTSRESWPRRRSFWPRTRSSGISWSSAAGPTPGRARSGRRARPRSSRSGKRTAGRRVLDPQDLRASARHVRERRSRERARSSRLPMYYPLAWYKGADETIDPFEEGRQKQVVGLIRTNFLKRFESSVVAFELSCDRLLQKLLAFVEVHSETDAEKKRLERWKSAERRDRSGYASERQLDFWGEDEDESEDEDIVPPEMLDAVERLDREEYDVDEMMAETYLDLDQIVHFLEEATEVRAEARRQAQEAHPPAQVEGPRRTRRC